LAARGVFVGMIQPGRVVRHSKVLWRSGSVGAATVALVASMATATPVRSATGQAFVRVNQIGYATTSTAKRAYLMASAAETGATFTVKNKAGTTVFSGPVGASLGKWSTAYPDVYALDFSSVTATGMDTITVSGPIAATSPPFAIATPANLDASSLSHSLAFYQVQRDGPDYIASALRTAPAHLNDEHAMTYLTPKVSSSGTFRGDLTPLGVTLDASGGWWDAGDYLKFVQTTSYTVDLLLEGVRDYPTQMGSGSTSSNFTAEAKFGAQWLLHMWDDPTKTLYYQVGIGEGNSKTTGDHDIWRLPQADDTYQGCPSQVRYICNRPVFRAAPPGSLISPNLAGRDAAALAEAYQVFKTSDPTFANACLLAAEHIFDLANTNPSGDLLTVIPFSFYPETEWRDDLELGATELYFAVAGGSLPPGLPHTDPMFYLSGAAHWANAYITGPGDAADTLNLYDVSGLAHAELYKAIAQAGNPSGLEVTQAQLLADLKKQLDGAVAQGTTEPFGFGFPWGVYDTTSHGAGLVVMASEYDQLTGTSAYAAYGQEWLANILGANAWGSSFIVGDGTTFPDCLQHQVANLAGHLDGTQPVLNGAAVEGPNGSATHGLVSGMIACPANGVDTFAQFNGHGAEWKDDMQSYSNTEPAIDLTASSPLAFAREMAGQF
jgi:endoglucanase